MAAVKMAGFDVTPSRPSFSTIWANSPEVIRPRRMLSYQMLWPNFWMSSRGFAMMTSKGYVEDSFLQIFQETNHRDTAGRALARLLRCRRHGLGYRLLRGGIW